MTQKYRKPAPTYTQNTFSNDPPKPRTEELRRDVDQVAAPVVTTGHLDKAVQLLITDVIKPKIEQNGTTLPVPVYYASAEHWSTVQKNGVIRDEKNKIMLPLIVFKRESIEDRDELERQNTRANDPDLGIQFAYKRYSVQNRYDAFSKLTNAAPKLEFYTVTTPDYVKATYTITIWTEFTAQLNKIVESFIYNERTAKLPYPYRFINEIDSYSFENVNNIGEDRVAKCVISMSIYGFLIPANDGAYDMNVKKTLSARKIITTTEGVASLDDIPRT